MDENIASVAAYNQKLAILLLQWPYSVSLKTD